MTNPTEQSGVMMVEIDKNWCLAAAERVSGRRNND